MKKVCRWKEDLLAGKLRTLEQAIGIHGQRSLLGFQVRTNWKLCLISDLLLIFNPILLSQISFNTLVRHLGIKSGIHNHPNVVSQKWEGKIMLCSFSLKTLFYQGLWFIGPFYKSFQVPEQQMQLYLQSATI